MSFFRNTVLVLVALGITLGLVLAIEHGYPHSSPGVSIIASDTARLPQGDHLVFLHTVGKTTYIWTLTYNGRDVTMNEAGWWIFGGQHRVVPVSPSRSATQYMGLWQGTFTFTAQHGWVKVAWPYGWNYHQ